MARGQSPSGSCHRCLRRGPVRRLGYPFTPRTRLPAPHIPPGGKNTAEAGTPRPAERRRAPWAFRPDPPRVPRSCAHARGRVCARAHTRPPPRAHTRRVPDGHATAPWRAAGVGSTDRLLRKPVGAALPALCDLSERVSEGPSVPPHGFRPHDRSWQQTSWTEPALTPKHCSTFWKLLPG